MATIINPTFGKISGKVGDFVIRNRNGKTFICRKSLGRSKSSFSESELVRQKRFGLNCKLAKCINQIDEYKVLWKKNLNGKANTFNAIAKSNYPLVNIDGSVQHPHLAPDSIDMDFSDSCINYSEGKIAIKLKPGSFDLVKDYKNDNLVMAAGIICLSNPLDDRKDGIVFLKAKSDVVKVSEGEETVLFIELDGCERQIVDIYEKRMFYFGFVSMDENGNIVNSVSTFSEELIDY